MARGCRGAAAAKKKKNGNKTSTTRSGGGGMVPIDEVLATNATLRDRLDSLGATRPFHVIEKRLKQSDVHPNQARLLFSCKSGDPALSPLTACFTEQETLLVGNKSVGLLVTALDRAGRSYDLACKYLACNKGYRFIAGWKTFLEANGLTLDDEGSFQRDVHVELWAFRSRALPNRFVDVKNKTGTKKEKKIREETGHPDGALGLVLLHHEHTATGAGTGEEQDAATACAMTKHEMVAKYGEEMANAAIGMGMLRWG